MMRGYKERESAKDNLIFDELGDALSYGMHCELPYLSKDMSGDKMKHLYASLSYMYLNEYIDRTTVGEIKRELRLASANEKNLNSIVEKLSRKIFGSLLDKYQFDNLDTLIELLNGVTIPHFYFDIGRELVNKCMTNIFIYNDYLYYIASDDGHKMFVKLKLKDVSADMALNFCDEKKIIGYGYDTIYGFDKNLKRVYLGVNNQIEFYHYYDLLTDTFVVCDNRFFALNDGIPFVITRDGYLGYMMGETVHKVKEYYDYEEYTLRKGYFMVTPQSVIPNFFYPYCMTYDGKFIPADIDECKRVIWHELEKIALGEQRPMISFLMNKEDNQIPMPSDFSISSIINHFIKIIPASERCTNKRYILLDNIFQILLHYIDKNEDITRLLYVLYDVNSKLCNKGITFPSEELYWEFKELDMLDEESNRLREILKNQDYDKLKIMFVKNDSKYECEESKEMIGGFSWNDTNLDVYSTTKEYGLVVGNQIIPNINFFDFSGIVTYDCFSDMYYITCYQDISDTERLKILKEYNISEDKTMFVVHEKGCRE